MKNCNMRKFFYKLSNKHYIQCSLTISLTVIVLWLTTSLWINNRLIVIKFASLAEKDIQYQIFYTESDSQNFNEHQSVSQNVKSGYQKVKFVLPIDKIVKFRLDIGRQPEKIIISGLKINGRHKILPDYNEFHQNQIDKLIIKGRRLHIESMHDDPFLIYKKPLNLLGKIQVDWCRFIIVSTLTFLLMYKLVYYLADFKLRQQYSRIDIVFLTIFFGLLFIPMSHFSDAEKSEKENRMLAKYPQFLIKNKGINNNFGKQFNEWFNDRFNSRDMLISLYNEIYKLQNIEQTDKVLVGKNGWMFYKLDNGYDNFANRIKLSEKDMQKGLEYLKSIDLWCQKNGKEFYYIIAPDKNKIYGEHYRIVKKVAPDSNGIGYQFINYIKKHSKIKAAYLRDDIMRHKNKELLYYKNDTHWNYLGAYYGYITLMNLMNKPSLDVSFEKTDNHEPGDLTNMYRKIEESTIYNKPKLEKWIQCSGGEDRNSRKCINPEKTTNIFMLRDSFATALMPYLSLTFKNSDFVWRYNITKKDLDFIKQNVDIVILENVERYTPVIFNQNFPKD